MRRIINEINHRQNGVNREGGIKVGDFGVGGRTYREEHREGGQIASKQQEENGSQNIRFPRECGLVCFAFFSIISGCILYYVEREYFSVWAAIPEAKLARSYSLPKIEPENNNLIVHATTLSRKYPILEDNFPFDPYFGVSAGARVAVMRRVTEYCQWEETEHRVQRLIEKKPDHCKKMQDDRSECEKANCGYSNKDSCMQSPCCSWYTGESIYETEISYSYHKGWKRTRINALMFDNPIAYYNPQRDPAPSVQYAPDSLVDISAGDYGQQGIRVRSHDLAPVLSPWQNLYLDQEKSDRISSRALADGFSEISHLHFYSRVPKDGWDNPVVKAAASYLIDGIIDVNSISQTTGIESLLGKAGLNWITMGTCNAGDVRVHFEIQYLPNELSVIGEQQYPNLIVPHTYSFGKRILLLNDKPLGVDALCQTIVQASGWQIFWQRCLVFLILLFGTWLGADVFAWNFGYVLLGASVCYCLVQTVCWCFFYGIPKTFAHIAVTLCVPAILQILIPTIDATTQHLVVKKIW